MGYTTVFEGTFRVSPPLDVKTYSALRDLAEDGKDKPGAPDAYCQWVPTDDGEGLEWDENEKFYCYVEWLRFIAEKVLAPKGYKLNGSVTWQGESVGDVGTITAKDNVITTAKGMIGGGLLAAAKDMLATHGNCGTIKQQEAADRLRAAIEDAESDEDE